MKSTFLDFFEGEQKGLGLKEESPEEPGFAVFYEN